MGEDKRRRERAREGGIKGGRNLGNVVLDTTSFTRRTTPVVLNGHESAERRRRQQRLDRSQPAAQLANQRPATLEVVGFSLKGPE